MTLRTTAPTRHASFAFIFLTVFLDAMGHGLITPVLPTLLKRFTQDFSTLAQWNGLLFAAYGVMQFLFTPLLGALSDAIGRRPVLLLSIFCLGLDFIVLALTHSLSILLLARILGGISSANFACASAYVADITTPQERNRMLGKLGAALGVGFIFGPAIGGVLGNINIQYPFFLAAALSLLNGLYGFFILPESLPHSQRSRMLWRKINPFTALAYIIRLPNPHLVWIYTLVMLTEFIKQAIWILYTMHRFDWGPEENGYAIFISGSIFALAQGYLLGPALQRWGENKTIIIGLISLVISSLVAGLTPYGWVMYFTTFIAMLSYTIQPTIQGIISKACPASEQGLAMGALSGMNSLMVIAGTTIGVPVLAYTSKFPPASAIAGLPFFVIILITLSALGLMWRVNKSRQAH